MREGTSIMKFDVRYVERRRNADGSVRWYWRRKGHLTVRLPDNKARRWSEAERLNAIADQADDEPAEKTIGWLIDDYLDSEEFRELAASTQGIYRRWCADLKSRRGDDHPSMLSRHEIVKFAKTLRNQPSTQRHAIVVIQTILDRALYWGLVEQNYGRKVKLARAPSRDQYWQPDQIEVWLLAAAKHDKAIPMRLAFLLLLYTAQRPIDVLQMTWDRFDGDNIRLRQQKTKRLAAMPCHQRLRQELATSPRVSTRIVPIVGAPKAGLQ